MKTLRDVVLHQVPVVEPQTSLAETIRLMQEHPLRVVALVGDEMYMGMFSEEALGSELIPPDADLSLLPVGPYVRPSRVVGEVNMPAQTLLSHMVRRGQNIVPVLENRTFKGVVTRQDLETALDLARQADVSRVPEIL